MRVHEMVTTQVGRLKAFRLKERAMRDRTKLRAFEPADEVEVLIYRQPEGFPND